MRANRVKWVVAAAAMASLVAAPVLAETAQMTGRFPAQYREAAMLVSLSIGRIDGRDGYQVGAAIERALGSTGHFDLQGRRRGGNQADGLLSGGVTSGVEDSYYRRKEKRCVERDANKKCTREQEFEIRCTQRVANLTADLRIVRYDGQIVYSAHKPLRQQIDWCEGQSAPRTAEEMITAMAYEVAGSVRNDIVPRTDTYRIRFRESTKDLPKPEVKPFKALIKLTQRDLRAACAGFAAMNGRAPGHASILFNLGLCAEAEGNLKRALVWYQLAQPLLGRRSEAETGAVRVQGRIAQDADDAERARRMR